jgi:transposase InsO family protein
VQYACEAYIQVLQEHQTMPSMSRPGHPHDNASCESFLKTLKREEIYANDYRDMEHLAEGIEEFIERYYNRAACIRHSDIDRQRSLRSDQKVEAKTIGKCALSGAGNETVCP